MIIKTRYRDIPWEEARKCQITVNTEKAGKAWEAEMRGKPLVFIAPAITISASRVVCGGPFFKLVNPSDENIVCPHIAEIGD